MLGNRYVAHQGEHAREQVRHEYEADAPFHHLYPHEEDLDFRGNARVDPGAPEEARELQQSRDAEQPDGAHLRRERPRVLANEDHELADCVEWQYAYEVHDKPAFQVAHADPPQIRHEPARCLDLFVKGEEKLHHHVHDKEQIDEAVRDKKRVHARIDKTHFEWSDNRNKYKKRYHDKVPAFDKLGLRKQARALRPAHFPHDGDLLVERGILVALEAERLDFLPDDAARPPIMRVPLQPLMLHNWEEMYLLQRQ